MIQSSALRVAVIGALAALPIASLLASARQATSWGSLSGVVVVDDPTRTPLGGAVVSLSGGGLERPVSAVTRADGSFLLDRAPAGELKLLAVKAGYLSTAYGATRAGRPGTAVTLLAGQRVAGLVIQLARGAVVTGMIRDEAGGPLADVAVSAFRLKVDGSAEIAGSTTTDDRGAYRLFGLGSGRYIVAGRRPFANSGPVEVIATEEMDRRLAALERSGLAARPSQQVPATAARPTAYGFSPVFYPGTTAADEAAIMTLEPGVVHRADFAMAGAPAGVVEGVVSTHDGSPLPAVTLALEQTGPSLPVDFTNRPRLSVRPTATDGRFAFDGVTPGRYALTAVSQPVGGAASPSPARLWAALEVSFDRADVSGVSLTLRPGVRLTGAALVDGPAGNLNAVRVTLTMTAAPVGGRPPLGFRTAMLRPVPLGPDGRFEVADVIPGSYVLSASGAGRMWLRSAIVDGQDALDVPIVLAESNAQRRVEMRFSERRGELAGTLRTPAGTPAVDYAIVVFTTDDRLWRPGARRVRLTRPSTDGRFIVSDLPGGEYFVAALTDVEPDDLADPSFLARLVATSVKVIVPEGGQAVQDLAIAR